MEYKETVELVEKVVDKALGSYAKATSELIASELGGLRKEISYANINQRDLVEQFKNMNGSLRDVCQWKATHIEETKSIKDKISDINFSRISRTDATFRVIQMIVLVTSVSFAIYFGTQNIKINKEKEKAQQEETK